MNFNLDEIKNEQIDNVKITASKGCYYVRGTIKDKYEISVSNEGEYRFVLIYNQNDLFSLKNIDYVSLKITDMITKEIVYDQNDLWK